MPVHTLPHTRLFVLGLDLIIIVVVVVVVVVDFIEEVAFDLIITVLCASIAH
jgi:hypothetical protein